MLRRFTMLEEVITELRITESGPQPREMRIRREDQPPKRRENKYAPIRTAYNTAQGAPHGFPPVLQGSAHMVFWMGPAVQAPFRGFASKRRSLSTGLHSTLRAFATGGIGPHFALVLAFRPSSKKPRHPRQRYTQVYLKC